MRSAPKQAPRSETVVIGVVLGAAAALAMVVVLVKVVPPWIASSDGLTGTDRAEEIGRARTAFLAILAGGVATIGAVLTGLSYRLNRQGHELDRAGQITERFTRAIDQLGEKDKLDVRVGGIYALERIARDSKEDHAQVVEVLTTYVKVHAPWPPKPPPANTAETPGEPAPNSYQSELDPPADVQAAITVLGRRDTSQDRAGAQVRLSDVDLRGVSMRGGHFEDARLRRANLEGARLEGTQLQGAKLRDANFKDADLGPNSELELSSADLEGASLQGATFQGAKLKEANLKEANLKGADLSAANLRGANLVGTNLQGGRLDGAKLEGALYGDVTHWPERFDPEAAGARRLPREDAPGSVPPAG